MAHTSRSGRLSSIELAAIDLTITALQGSGHVIGEAATSNNPHEIMADAMADLHHPLDELGERDREIIGQIKELASQLSVRTSLEELMAARANIVNGR